MIKLSTSLFSYAYEWNSRQYSFEQLFAITKKVALGNGLEIIGFQSFKGFPHIDASMVSETKRLMDKYGFEPACLDSNTDIARRRDRLMTTDETVEYLEPQIIAAQKLGFPILRVQMTTKPEVLQKMLPLAEKTGIKLGMELHTPYQVDHPAVLALREMYDKVNSPFLGFIPDFGTSMRAIPDALLYSFREAGVQDEWIAITKEIWYKDVPPPAKFAELHERVMPLGASPAQIGRLNMAFSMNGRQPVEKWREIVPQTVHLHGKFYGFDAAGEEPSIDYAAILRVFHKGGYDGYVSSEYEGSAFTDEFSAFDMVEKHHLLCQSILNNFES
jgi:sugar phosphate isomerase/epimerase